MELDLQATTSKEVQSSSDINLTQEAVEQPSPEILQRKLYFLVDQLKQMHANLPESYQTRITYDLLTELANTLLHDTVFDIVKGLMELQHVTEKHLQNLRSDVEKEYEAEVKQWTNKIKDPEELKHLLVLIKLKHKKELHKTDIEIIEILDRKVYDQQSTLNKAGVAGFYITQNPKEIKVQMYLLDFILRLSRLKFDPNK